MADATVAEEEYLQTLYWLLEAGLPMTAANLVRASQLSAPTVSEMVGRPTAYESARRSGWRNWDRDPRSLKKLSRG